MLLLQFPCDLFDQCVPADELVTRILRCTCRAFKARLPTVEDIPDREQFWKFRILCRQVQAAMTLRCPTMRIERDFPALFTGIHRNMCLQFRSDEAEGPFCMSITLSRDGIRITFYYMNDATRKYRHHSMETTDHGAMRLDLVEYHACAVPPVQVIEEHMLAAWDRTRHENLASCIRKMQPALAHIEQFAARFAQPAAREGLDLIKAAIASCECPPVMRPTARLGETDRPRTHEQVLALSCPWDHAIESEKRMAATMWQQTCIPAADVPTHTVYAPKESMHSHTEPPADHIWMYCAQRDHRFRGSHQLMFSPGYVLMQSEQRPRSWWVHCNDAGVCLIQDTDLYALKAPDAATCP